jgi:hypothetical protein
MGSQLTKSNQNFIRFKPLKKYKKFHKKKYLYNFNLQLKPLILKKQRKSNLIIIDINQNQLKHQKYLIKRLNCQLTLNLKI